jgi:hypothetical protein
LQELSPRASKDMQSQAEQLLRQAKGADESR